MSMAADESMLTGESIPAEKKIYSGGDLSSLRDQLSLNQDSRVLFFSTEGATDPVNYRKIVWEGAYAAPEK